jgi:hypothetical protein
MREVKAQLRQIALLVYADIRKKVSCWMRAYQLMRRLQVLIVLLCCLSIAGCQSFPSKACKPSDYAMPQTLTAYRGAVEMDDIYMALFLNYVRNISSCQRYQRH